MGALDIIALPGHPGMFARRVAVQAWQAAGSPRVNSAGRLYALQKHFWDGWRLRKPGFNPADNPDDETQALAHCRFVALDIDPTADRIKRLTAAGMVRPYKYEPWHWELPNVRSYGIVRSIPSTASGDITPIILEEEDDMKLLRFGYYNDGGRNRYTLINYTTGKIWQTYSVADATTMSDNLGETAELWSPQKAANLVALVSVIGPQASGVDVKALAVELSPLVSAFASADDIAAKVDQILRDDFAKVNANIDDQPTTFELRPKV